MRVLCAPPRVPQLRMASSRGTVYEELRSVDGGRLPLEETLKAVAIPPVVYSKCARVEHFLAEFTGTATNVVSHTLQLPDSFVAELIRFGAVHSCPVIPETSPNDAWTPQLGEEVRRMRAEAVERVGRHPQWARPQRVTTDAILHRNAYCRVHVHPKRFPAYYEHDWSRRLVLENDHCVVVNKPPGCQVPPRVDNQLECLTTWVQRLCGLETELKPVHRLDTGTEGLVVLAKSREFARYFQTLLLRQKGSLEKGYRALTQSPPPLGTLRHHVAANWHVKGQPRRTRVISQPTDGASLAELEIRDVQRVSLNEAGRRQWGVEAAYEVEIELKTGRTHQIRVQLAHEGYPLLGDGLYHGSPQPSSAGLCTEPTDACLGLQAATLTIQDGDLGAFFPSQETSCLRLEAGEPWWRETET